jgi:hypothetical protein
MLLPNIVIVIRIVIKVVVHVLVLAHMVAVLQRLIIMAALRLILGTGTRHMNVVVAVMTVAMDNA